MKTLESNASKTEYQVVIEKTGEVCKTLTVDEHDYATGERFWKLYDGFFDVLCDLDCISSRVLAVAISDVVPKYNTFSMSIRKLSAEAESNEKTVTRALKLLEEKDIIVTVHAPQKRKNGEWMKPHTLRTMMTFRFDPTGHRFSVHAVQLGDMVHAGSRLIHCFHFGCVVRCSSRCV